MGSYVLFGLRSYRNISFIINNNKVVWTLSDHTDEIYLPSSRCFCCRWCYAAAAVIMIIIIIVFPHRHRLHIHTNTSVHLLRHIDIATKCEKCEPKYNRQFHYLSLPWWSGETMPSPPSLLLCCYQKNAAIWITRNRNVISNK